MPGDLVPGKGKTGVLLGGRGEEQAFGLAGVTPSNTLKIKKLDKLHKYGIIVNERR